MKRVLSLLFILMILQSCSKRDDSQQIERGRLLVDASDCKTCHHPTNKIIGPSHLDVAKKYETTDENTKLLAGRIIKGGSGIWGEIPMSAHTDLSQADGEAMARYILSLDEQ